MPPDFLFGHVIHYNVCFLAQKISFSLSRKVY